MASPNGPPAGQALLDRYRLERVLAKRGAVTTRLMIAADGTRVVVKTLSVQRATSHREIELFEREAGVLKHLRHPAVPRYVEYAVEDGATEDVVDGDVLLHLVQTFVAGRTLDAWVKDGRSFTPAEATRVFRDLAVVLAALHETSPPLVHRDIKPQNILLDDEGRSFLVDFGAAKRAVKDGTAIGTFGFMAPEQMEGRAQPASDVFGLGMTMVFVLTHQEPDAFADHGGVRKAWRAHANVPDALAALLDDCIALDEARRPRDGAALVARIDALGRAPARAFAPAPAPAPARPRVLAAFGAAVAVLVASIAWLVAAPAPAPTIAPEVTGGPVPPVPTKTSPPLRPQRVPPSVRLGAPGLLENIACTSRAERALQSEERYRSWRKGDAAPTCREPYVSYGLYSLYDDAPGRCGEAADATEDADARSAARALADALATLTPTVDAAARYYDAEDFQDDGCAQGKELHARLLPQFAAVNAAYARVLEARRRLARLPAPVDEPMRSYRKVLDTALAVADPALPLSDRKAAVDAYKAALAASPQVRAIGVNVESLTKWARGGNDLGAQMAIGSVDSGTASALQMKLTFE